MSRCDHCVYRNSWDCDDGWDRASDDTLCNSRKNTPTSKRSESGG